MANVKDFPPRPPGDVTNATLDWLDLLRNRQNIDSLIALTTLAGGDEFYVFDASTRTTKKITADNIADFMGGGGGGGTSVVIQIIHDTDNGDVTATSATLTGDHGITPLTDDSEIIVEVTCTVAISDMGGSSAQANLSLFDVENAIGLDDRAFGGGGGSGSQVAGTLVLRAIIANGATTPRTFHVDGQITAGSGNLAIQTVLFTFTEFKNP